MWGLFLVLQVWLGSVALIATAAGGLKVKGTRLTYGDSSEAIFLSGANQPWLHYGADFGNHRPTDEDYCTLKNDYLLPLQRAGGHTLRFWLFVEGSGGIPQWTPDGIVNGTDAAGSLAQDMRRFVQLAASMDIVIVWCLWNGAVLRDTRTISMIVDPSGAALKSFVDHALTPLVTALKSEPGIGAWEIINEPEGSVASNMRDTEPCFDTTKLKGTGAGWAQQPGAKGKSGIGHPLPMKYLQRFVAVQAAAIHAADPGALVTVGSWNAVANSDVDGHRNYWSDTCLQKAANLGGVLRMQAAAAAAMPTLDFYQIHSYPSGGAFDGESPFTGLNKSHFGLTKPLVIGEFPAEVLNGGLTDTQLYQYAYAAGFDGAWGWALNADAKNDATLLAGMQSIRHNRGVVLTVGANTNPPKDVCPPAPPIQPIPVQPKPACTDKAPPGQYTCAQQKSWGKCRADFMRGFCCKTCWGCTGVLQCGGP